MASIRKTNVSAASQPIKAGEAPANVTPKITFQDSMNAAAQKIDALLRGGVDCVTYIGSALLIGYLSNSGAKVKLSVMRDEFSLALGKKGLGGTQTKKYLDYGFKIAQSMFKECSYGMEMAGLLAADNPDKAHNAVKAWLSRHCTGKKTEHGTKLDDATSKLNMLGVFLGFETDPGKPEKLETEATKREATDKRRTNEAKRIEADPGILNKVPAATLAATVAKVYSFDVLVAKHFESLTEVSALKKEFAAMEKAFHARVKALTANMGKRKAKGETSSEAAAA